jgi:hypothetical protein
MRKIIFILIILALFFSCKERTNDSKSVITKGQSKYVRHVFKSFAITTDTTWKNIVENDSVAGFVKKGESSGYISNFIVMIYKKVANNTKISIDYALDANFREASDCFLKLKFHSYDTLRIRNCNGRKVSLSAQLKDKTKIGVLFYIYEKEKFFITAIFQGENIDGSFRKRIPEFEEIEKSLTF